MEVSNEGEEWFYSQYKKLYESNDIVGLDQLKKTYSWFDSAKCHSRLLDEHRDESKQQDKFIRPGSIQVSQECVDDLIKEMKEFKSHRRIPGHDCEGYVIEDISPEDEII